MDYRMILVEILVLNGWYLLPEYPFHLSLELMDGDKEVQDYCKKVLSDIEYLTKINTGRV